MPDMRKTHQTGSGPIDLAGEPPANGACKASPGVFEPVVDRNRCEGKGPCVAACPERVLEMGILDDEQRSALSMLGRLKAWAHGGRQVQIAEPDACRACGACVRVCPEHAITLRRRSP
jgi:4Fe-4S ferredoxin